MADFQIMYAPATWTKEKQNWRSVVQLNLIRNVITILDALSEELAASSPTTSHPSSPHLATIAPIPLSPVDDLASSGRSENGTEHTLIGATGDRQLLFSDQHRMLKLRLAPLRRVETDLRARLGADEETSPGIRSPLVVPGAADLPQGEATVRSWRGAFSRQEQQHRETLGEQRVRNRSSKLASADDVTDVLYGCREDIKVLSRDSTVREMLLRKKIYLDELPGLWVYIVSITCPETYTS
jgi:guanine nucleotide-binding protein alpha-1 subunit